MYVVWETDTPGIWNAKFASDEDGTIAEVGSPFGTGRVKPDEDTPGPAVGRAVDNLEDLAGIEAKKEGR